LKNIIASYSDLSKGCFSFFWTGAMKMPRSVSSVVTASSMRSEIMVSVTTVARPVIGSTVPVTSVNPSNSPVRSFSGVISGASRRSTLSTTPSATTLPSRDFDLERSATDYTFACG
jgi:hypothetical protein